MPTTRECETITKELQGRYALDEELDLKEIAPLMLQLRDVLPTPSFKFLLTLCESVFSKLDPELVQVSVMKKKLEAALAAQAKTLGKRGGDEAASEPPDRLCATGPHFPKHAPPPPPPPPPVLRGPEKGGWVVDDGVRDGLSSGPRRTHAQNPVCGGSAVGYPTAGGPRACTCAFPPALAALTAWLARYRRCCATSSRTTRSA